MTTVGTLPQPKEQPFGNSIRGDVSKFRFDGGHAATALPDKHVRRVISHDFTAQKSQQNDVSLDRQMEKPHGRRWSAAHDWQEHHKQQRVQQEHDEETKQLKHISDTLAGILRQLPEYQTSAANPLRPKTPATAGAAADSADADPAADGSSPAKLPKTVSFIERSHNLKDSLEIGSLAPTSNGKEAAAAEAAAEDAAAVAVAAEKEKQQQLLQQLAEQVIKEYPHGLPKRLQHELRSRGIALPSLGFGETQSAPSFDAAFSTR